MTAATTPLTDLRNGEVLAGFAAACEQGDADKVTAYYSEAMTRMSFAYVHPEPYDSTANQAHVAALTEQLRDMHRSPDDIKCSECGHWVSDRALPDFERERWDPDNWCDACLADLAADNNAFEREYAAIGRGGRG